MKLFIKFLLCLPLIFLFVSCVSAQQTEAAEPQITRAEETEAVALAKLFHQRLQETKDVGPLVNEFFVSNYSEKLTHMLPTVAESSDVDIDYCDGDSDTHINEKSWAMSCINYDLLLKADRAEILNYYTNSISFWYLLVNYTDLLKKSNNRELNFGQLMPSELTSILKSNKHLSRSLIEDINYVVSDSPYKGDPEVRLKTKNDLREINTALTKAIKELQQLSKQSGNKKIEPLYPGAEFKAALIIGKEVCNEIYGNRNIIRVYVPEYIVLHLIRENGRLKIFYIDLPTD